VVPTLLEVFLAARYPWLVAMPWGRRVDIRRCSRRQGGHAVEGEKRVVVQALHSARGRRVCGRWEERRRLARASKESSRSGPPPQQQCRPRAKTRIDDLQDMVPASSTPARRPNSIDAMVPEA
jgi:hypothetical protein